MEIERLIARRQSGTRTLIEKPGIVRDHMYVVRDDDKGDIYSIEFESGYELRAWELVKDLMK